MKGTAEFIQTVTRPITTMSLVAALIYLAITKDGDALTALVALAGVAVNSWFQAKAVAS